MTNQISITNNGYTLRGLNEHVENPKGVVVMYHGFTGHKNETGNLFKTLAKILEQNNYEVFRFDYMGNGDSDGEFQDYTFETVLSDCFKMLDFVLDKYSVPLTLIGFSMGGAMASYVSKYRKEDIDKLVLISPAFCMGELMDARRKALPIIDNKLIDMGGFLLNTKCVDSYLEVDFYEDLEKFDKKVLMIQGLDDISVKPYVTKRASEIYKNVEYWLVENAGHGYNPYNIRKKLNDKILNFMNGEE